MGVVSRAVLVLLAPVVAAACGDATVRDEGLDADLRVEGATFVRGQAPGAADGPKVETVNLVRNDIRAGEVGKACSGAMDGRATAAVLALAGDPGYWVVPAGVPDQASPRSPSFRAALSFSRALRSGPHDLLVRAVDDGGRFGPPFVRTLSATGVPTPAGLLVVSLSWDTEADLDLHLVDPTGIEVFARKITSAVPPKPGEPRPPGSSVTGGVLDVDSNAACVIDGRRVENVVYAGKPPSGRYAARVDTFSLCGEAAARWRLTAAFEGRVLGEARGTSTDFDTRFPHDRGAGLLALEFDVP